MTISITALFALGMTASAATEYDVSQGSVVIETDGEYIITGTTTTNSITVASGVDATITLENVNINVSSIPSASAFRIADDSTGNVTINLVGDNTLTSGAYCAGLQKNGSIYSGTLAITGTGSLTAQGGLSAAGIGGGNAGNGSKIAIRGGTVTAKGGEYGAGIGGGFDGIGSYITINGGTVDATGGMAAAGIGGGYNSSVSYITISNNAEVTATGGYNAAGNGQVTLTWTAPEGATQYAVYYSTDGVNYARVSASVTEESFTFTGLKNGTKYWFTVKAYGNGAWSGIATAVTDTPNA